MFSLEMFWQQYSIVIAALLKRRRYKQKNIKHVQTRLLIKLEMPHANLERSVSEFKSYEHI